MGGAKAKTINLLLYEGNLGGVISIEDSSWNSGELYSAPRKSVMELLDTGACNKYGVYLLLSSDKVYVGQSSDLAKRITQHTVGKDWWESVVILTTKDDSLNHADIDYLESVLIDKAFSVNRLDCDNKTKGNPPKVDKFRKVYLGQYLDEALFLMQLIGISVFAEGEKQGTEKASGALISTIDTNTRIALGKRAKAESIQFLKDHGIAIGKNATYAVKQDKKDEYWANPNVSLLDKDWDIILNNVISHELIVLRIPAGTLKMKQADNVGLYSRNDKKERIDLNISIGTLVDRRSKIDFSGFEVARISYEK